MWHSPLFDSLNNFVSQKSPRRTFREVSLFPLLYIWYSKLCFFLIYLDSLLYTYKEKFVCRKVWLLYVALFMCLSYMLCYTSAFPLFGSKLSQRRLFAQIIGRTFALITMSCMRSLFSIVMY